MWDANDLPGNEAVGVSNLRVGSEDGFEGYIVGGGDIVERVTGAYVV